VNLRPKPGFDPTRVNWGGPDEPQSNECSYCDAPIAEDACPLRMWREDGSAAVFCDGCAERWLGMVVYDGPNDEDAA